MTAVIIGSGAAETRIPFGGQPAAIPGARRVVLGYEGDALVVLDLSGASFAQLADLSRALAGVIGEGEPAAPVPLRKLRGVPRYEPEAVTARRTT